MSKNMKRDLIFVGITVVLAIFLGAGTALLTNSARAYSPAEMDRLLDMTDAGAPATAAASPEDALLLAQAGEVRGKPLSATGAAPADAAPAEGVAPPPPDGTSAPLRTLNQAGVDLVEKLEGKKTGEDLFKFERTKDGRFLKVTFAALGSYEYIMPDPDEILQSETPWLAPKDQTPEQIDKLTGEPVVLVGFMVPIDVNTEGKITSFALTQNQMFCCYGVPPAMNEWVMVEMEDGKAAEYVMDMPVAVYGGFEVGEEIEDGYVLSLYRMAGNEVVDVKELLRRQGQEQGK